MNDDMTKRKQELSGEYINEAIPHTLRDEPAWHYSVIDFEKGFDAGVAEMQVQVEFLKMYFNPKDTSFKNMIETFSELSDEQKQALINLTEALLKTREAK